MDCVHALLPCLQVSRRDALQPDARRDCVPSSPARSDAVIHQGPAPSLHYRKPVSGRPKSGCRRPGDSLRGDEKATISDRTRRDGQRFARRVHACMSWYTMIYDNIGPTPGPGLIEAKVQRARTLPSFVALLKDDLCRPTIHIFCLRVHSKCW